MSSGIDTFEAQQQVVEQIRESRERIEAELSKVIIGQKRRHVAVADQPVCRRALPDHRCTGTGQDACWCGRSHRSFI